MTTRRVLVRGGEVIRLPVRDPRVARPEVLVQTGHTNWVESIALSGDGRLAITGARDGNAILWDVRTGKKLRALLGNTSPGKSVALSADGQYALTCSWDHMALWDVRTGTKFHAISGITSFDICVALSDPDKWSTGPFDHQSDFISGSHSVG